MRWFGDNGILTQAQNAKIAAEKASILENLDTELAAYNIDTLTGDPGEVKAMLINLLNKGVIDTVLRSDSSYGKILETDSDDIIMGVPKFDEDNNYTINYAVKKDDYSILLSAGSDGIYKSGYGEVKMSAGGKVEGGTTLVTDKAFESGGSDTPAEDKGKFTIENDATVMFTTEIGKNGEELSILVKSGKHAEIKVFKNMTLTNAGLSRSAIDIEPGGILDLWIADGAEVVVNSGLGAIGDTSDYLSSNKGGYAGIHVPWKDLNNNGTRDENEYAIINIKGSGTLKALGGDAGDGNTYLGSSTSSLGGSGGGGAGAGIGGNGGDGTGYAVGKGSNGGTGENCGEINIYNTVKVYAYGGAGGSGADATSENGGGGGGYPAAGIGGGGAGGAGGTCCSGGGGYSGGGGDRWIGTATSENLARGAKGGKNGDSGESPYNAYIPFHSGSGYNAINVNDNCPIAYSKGIDVLAGGMGGISSRSDGHYAGDGGKAGQGGIIKKSTSSQINAYNGNKYTDETWIANADGSKSVSYITGHDNPSITPANQAEIYAQNGIINKRFNISYCNNHGNNTSFSIAQVYNATGITILTNYSNPTSGSHQGVGSGAGYIEVSNGSYEIDPSLN